MVGGGKGGKGEGGGRNGSGGRNGDGGCVGTGGGDESGIGGGGDEVGKGGGGGEAPGTLGFGGSGGGDAGRGVGEGEGVGKGVGPGVGGAHWSCLCLCLWNSLSRNPEFLQGAEVGAGVGTGFGAGPEGVACSYLLSMTFSTKPKPLSTVDKLPQRKQVFTFAVSCIKRGKEGSLPAAEWKHVKVPLVKAASEQVA